MAYGMTNYSRNKIIDLYHRGQAYVAPATLYLALVTTTPTASTAGAEVAGTGYERVPVLASMDNWSGTQGVGSTVASNGTSGITANNEIFDFGIAGSAWGTVSHWEFWDAPTGGIRHFYGEITNAAGVIAPRSIVLNDPVAFPVGAVQIQW